MPGPLDGVRIVDLTGMLAGPWATMILGDQGADVIKVEPPGRGDHTRAMGGQRGGLSTNFLNLNRSKRSLALDLKCEEGRAVLLDLARGADVMVQNFRSGVVDRLGVGEAAVREVRPDIVYVSISGFGERGPFAEKPAYDPVIQAVSGLTSVQAGSDEARPRLIRTVLPDKLTAITAAQAITAALFARQRSGEGQHLRLSMFDSVLSFLWASDMNAETRLDREPAPRRPASEIDLIFATADGYMTVATNTDREWAALTRAVERPEWLTDERFASPVKRTENINIRLTMVQAVLETRGTAEWLALLEAEGVPCAPVLSRGDLIDHPHTAASGILLETEHPHAGRLRQTRPPARFEATPANPGRGAPRLGEHSDEILREIGYDQARISGLKDAGVI
jgi:crotonobetainyl-CoA:carnitine CoA-transferase CaiB-like acyl-CoA transferase